MTIAFTKKLGAGLFGGEGFILQQLTADEDDMGLVFMHGGGTIVCKELKDEELSLSTGCLMAFSQGVEYEIGQPGLKNALLGGEFFLAKLRGTGSVWVQSTPGANVIDLIVSALPTDSKDDDFGEGLE